jgi:energy-coupling factor transporter ATP-binding protein EcfA2
MAELAIRTEHLSRNFGMVQAVNDLSLEVPAGIVFGFLGQNGAGKTATIHLLLGLLVGTLGASAGVLLSLRVSTVRQAQQMLSIGTLVVSFGVLALVGLLPKDFFPGVHPRRVFADGCWCGGPAGHLAAGLYAGALPAGKADLELAR